MTKQEFLSYCSGTYNTSPDYPFDEDFETTVLRHADNRKWYALVMRVSRRKFGFDSDEVVDVLQEMVPTYHPNRRVRADHTVVAATGNTALFSREEIAQKLRETEHPAEEG